MEYRTLGRTGTIVSALCLGTMTFGNESSEEVSHAQLDRFVEVGGNFIDTADVYSRGGSEEVIGRWLAARSGARDELVIATKGRFPMGDDPNAAGLTRVHLSRALDASLSGRGLRWRIESWRTGMPYAQVVLKHTLRYRIDHLFLIEAGSGLVIHRESAPELSDLDSDAVAGMLTAIQQFVRDSVGTEAATLDVASVGEHLLWVESAEPDLDLARRFAEAVHGKFPGKRLSYNCSPSFNWKRHLDDDQIAGLRREFLDAAGNGRLACGMRINIATTQLRTAATTTVV